MKFHTAGTFETEALIDIAMRLVARLQDADVAGIGGISVTLTPLDKKGAPCPLLLDGAAIDGIEIDCHDFARPEAAPCLMLGSADRRTPRKLSARRRPRS
jgi:hypothetical protein